MITKRATLTTIIITLALLLIIFTIGLTIGGWNMNLLISKYIY